MTIEELSELERDLDDLASRVPIETPMMKAARNWLLVLKMPKGSTLEREDWTDNAWNTHIPRHIDKKTRYTDSSELCEAPEQALAQLIKHETDYRAALSDKEKE